MTYAAGLAGSSMILSTGANIWMAMQQGEINAIYAEMRKSQLKFQKRMSKIDKDIKLQNLEVQYEQEATNRAQALADSMQGVAMAGTMQGRTADSYASIQAADDRKYLEDMKSLELNQDYQKAMIEGDFGVQQAMYDADISMAGMQSDAARRAGNIAAVGALTGGITQMYSMGMFDSGFYGNQPQAPASTGSQMGPTVANQQTMNQQMGSQYNTWNNNMMYGTGYNPYTGY